MNRPRPTPELALGFVSVGGIAMPFSEAPTVAAQEPCDPFACPPPPGPPTPREVVLGFVQQRLRNNLRFNNPAVAEAVRELVLRLLNR